MNRVQIKSSNIKSLAFDGEALEIEFKNNSIYRYTSKYEEMTDRLKSIYEFAISDECKSVGAYIHLNVIKSNSWNYKKVDVNNLWSFNIE